MLENSSIMLLNVIPENIRVRPREPVSVHTVTIAKHDDLLWLELLPLRFFLKYIYLSTRTGSSLVFKGPWTSNSLGWTQLPSTSACPGV